MALTKIDDRGLKTPIDLLDNEKIRFGTGNDLEIYHDGSHSFIKDAGTGNLRLGAADLRIQTEDFAENYILGTKNGSVDLYYDNSKKLETVSSGVQITDNLGIGVAPNRELHVKGLDAIVRLESTAATGRNILEFYDSSAAKGSIGWPASGNDHMAIQQSENADMWFSTNDIERLRIDSTGRISSGKHGIGTYNDASEWFKVQSNDSAANISIVGSNDTHSSLNLGDEDDFNIQKIKSDHTNNSLQFFTANTERLRITSAGNVSIPNDSGKFTAGTGDDLQIYHDGTDSIISHQGGSGGDLIIQTTSSDDDVFIKCNDDFIVNVQGGAENAIIARNSGAVELYYDGSKKFETTSAGVQVTGTSFHSDNIKINVDNAGLYIGASDDLEIRHDGDSSYINHVTSGSDLVIDAKSPGDDLILRAADDVNIRTQGNEAAITCIGDGSVELYHNGTKKARTTSSGWLIESGYLHAFKDEADSAYSSGHTSHVIQANANGANGFVVENSADTTPYGMIVRFSDVAVDNNTVYFFRCSDSGATRMTIYSSGDVNTSDDGTLTSDETLKENIVDATSKLEDIKKLKVRNFNWKASYHPEKSKQKHIGFIAQEVEQIFPSLIQEHDISPGDPDDGHTPVMKKSIKQAWAPILVKALQEAIAKIETLETEVAALKAK